MGVRTESKCTKNEQNIYLFKINHKNPWNLLGYNILLCIAEYITSKEAYYGQIVSFKQTLFKRIIEKRGGADRVPVP